MMCARAKGAMRKTDGAGRLNQRFCRMWEFYLASSELAFRYGGLMVFQVQLARRLDAREREGGPRVGGQRCVDAKTTVATWAATR
jgi:hypothetical protein